MKKNRFYLLAASLVLSVTLVAPTAWARETRTEQDSAIYSVAGVYAMAGSLVNIAESLHQDAYLAGSQVLVSAPITGDVFAAGSAVTVSDQVDGSVRAAGNTVTIDGVVKGNVLVFGSAIHITKKAVIEGDLNAYGASVVIDGYVAGSVDVAGADLAVGGTVDGPLIADVDKASFGSSAVLGGIAGSTVTINASQAPSVAAGAQGTELIQYTQVERQENEDRSTRAGGMAAFFGMMFMWKLFMLFGGLVVVVVAVLAAPKWFDTASLSLKEHLGKSVGWGALVLFATPPALLVVAGTIIGLPLAMLVGMAYFLAIVAGKIVVSTWLGRMLVRTHKGQITTGKLVGSAMLGALILWILWCIPFLGMLVHLLSVMFGLGAVVMMCMNKGKKLAK